MSCLSSLTRVFKIEKRKKKKVLLCGILHLATVLNMEQLPGTCVILTCGLPGSGKSYFCGKLKEFFTAVGLSCGLISFDDFETSKEFWDDASFHLNRQAALAAFNKCLHLSDRLDVIIVDDTMHLKSMRKKITSLTKACRAFNLVLCVQVDLELSEARNSCRSDNSRVSAEVPLFILLLVHWLI